MKGPTGSDVSKPLAAVQGSPFFFALSCLHRVPRTRVYKCPRCPSSCPRNHCHGPHPHRYTPSPSQAHVQTDRYTQSTHTRTRRARRSHQQRAVISSATQYPATFSNACVRAPSPPRPTHKHQAPPPSPHPHAPANTSSTTKPRIAHAKVKHVMSCAVGKCMHIPPSHPHPTPSRRQHLRTACTLVLSLGIWGLQPATWCSATFLHRRPKITPSSTCIHHLSLAVVQAHDCTLRSTKETISIALCTLFGLLRLQQAS